MKSTKRRRGRTAHAVAAPSARRLPRGLGIALIFVGLAALVLLAYWDLWKASFYKDDFLWLSIGMDLVRSPSHLFQPDPVNTEAVVRVSQRILTGLTFAVAGTRPAPYYAVSILLHLTASALVFLVLRRLLERAAPDSPNPRALWLLPAAGATAFATTYNHSAAVMWISAQSTLLVTVVALGLVLYLIAHEHRLREPRFFLGALGLFALALYSKNTVVAFPIVIGFYLLVASPLRNRHRRAKLTLSVVMLGMGMAQALFTKIVLGRLQLVETLKGGDSSNYALSALPGNLLGAFLSGVVSPPQYFRWLPDLPYPVAAVVLLALVGVAAALLPTRRLLALGLVWVLAAPLPITLFDYTQYDAVHATVGRYYYLAFVGMVTLAMAGIHGILTRWRLARADLPLVLALTIAYAAWQVRLVRYQVGRTKLYTAATMKLIDSSLEFARADPNERNIVYAQGWELDDDFIDRASRLYFEPSNRRLEGAGALRAFREHPIHDGIVRYVADFDRKAQLCRIEVLDPSLWQSDSR